MYFVWVKGQKGPEAQRWNENPPIGGNRHEILRGPIEIKDRDAKVKMRGLIKKYPLEGEWKLT